MNIDIASLRGLDAHRSADAELAARLAELNAEASGQPFNADQKAEFEQVLTDRGTLAAIIEELETREAAVAAALGSPKSAESPKFGLPNIRKAAEDIFDLDGYREKVRSITQLPAALRDGAMRVVDQLVFPTAEDPSKARERLTQLVERHRNDANGWISEHVIATSSPAYGEAWGQAMKGKSVFGKMQAVLQTYADADGGLAIPVQIDPTFINVSDGAVNPLRAISRVETTVAKDWQAITTAGVTAGYSGERTTTGASDGAPTDFDNPTVTPVRADVSVKVSLEYLQDYGPGALQTEIGGLIADAKDILEADKFFNGDGSGEPEGIIAAIVTDTTSLVTTITNDVFARADLTKLEKSLPPRFRAKGRMVANIGILELIRAFGTAGEPYGPLSSANTDRLLGYPVHEASAMDDVATDAKKILLFGDFSKFAIVDRLGLFTKVMDDRDGNGLPTGNSVIYAAWRNSSKVLAFNAFRLLKVS